MDNSFHILLISGSIRLPSYTRTLVETVEEALTRHGANATHWNLREAPLPIADPEFHEDPLQQDSETIRRFVSAAQSSDGFVLASPLYHNSYSGVLKNALDTLAIEQFYFKPVGLLGHGGFRSTQAVDHLRIVVRGLQGIAIPTQVCTFQNDFRNCSEAVYELTSEPILQRIERFAVELIFFAAQLRLLRRQL